ncbi:MAG TPA: disulfide bond formation protein B [Acetobacteraceae bacterium]|nr:disulfide bond formation protein B [Acetobacteraceae bacterium]
MTRERGLALLSILAAGLALGVAIGSERLGGLVPCALCLVERWPYRIALALGVLALVLPRRAARPVLLLLALVVLGDAAIAFVHVGVEQGWWKSPLPECAAPHFTGGSIAQMLAHMPARPSKPCDSPTYLIPGLPLSMALLNMLYALVFSLGLAALVARGRRSGT